MKNTFFLLVIMVAGAGCFLFPPSESARISHVQVPLALVETTDAVSYSEPVSSIRGMAHSSRSASPAVPGGGGIILRAEVSPPVTPDGTPLQASHVSLSNNGKYAFVTYMLQGDLVYGGLDVFDVSDPSYPTLVSEQVFSGVDLSVVFHDGSYVYAGGQKVDQSGNGNSAYIRAIQFTGNKLIVSGTPVERSLPGYFVTGISATGGTVYVTTGTTNQAGTLAAGLYALTTGTLTDSGSVTTGLPDLRAVSADNSEISVFTAQWPSQVQTQESRLVIYDSALVLQKSIELTGYTAVAEAKSGIAYISPWYAIASNRSGVVLVNPSGSGSIAAVIPAPSLAGIAESLQSSNSVSTGEANAKKLFFIANGEAGLWVGDAGALTDTGNGIAGSIRFANGQSVNYADAKNRVVVAATGTGGLKIMELSLR